MPSEPLNSQSWSFQDFFERKYLPILSLFSVIGIFLVHFFLKDNESLRGALGAVFDAFLVASFLAWVVDPVLKQGLLKEGVRSIFRYIYGYNLPPALQRFFDETIVTAKELRTECKLHWKVTLVSGSQDRVQVPLHTTFGVLNFVNERRSYRHKVFAFSDTPGTEGSVESMYCFDREKQVYKYQLAKNQLKDGLVGNEGHDSKFGPPVELEPRSSDDKSRFLFGVHYAAQATWPTGLDWFLFSEMTTGVEVIITVDEALKDHRFSLIPSPPDGSEWAGPTYDPQWKEFRCQWQFSRLFVPNEIMVIRWRSPESVPKSAHSASTSAKDKGMISLHLNQG